MMKYASKIVPLLGLLALVASVGCSVETSGRVRARNVGNATVTVLVATESPATAVAEVPASAATTSVAAPTTMPATEAPAGPTATEPFVALWIISGTPTPTPGGAVASAPTTAVTAAPGGAVATSTRRPTNTPAGGAAASGPGNPGRGQQIFTGIAGCNACHDVQAGVQIVGPTLKGIASRAAQRQPGVAADVYLRESILNPNKYLVPGFAQGLMPQTFSNTLSAGQINDLIAYLMTLG